MVRATRTQLQILTANRLTGGEVVYAGPSGWRESLVEAEVFRTPESAERRLKEADADICAGLIVEPYLFDVQEDENGVRPVSMRELIRARGPTIRPDLGKQASLSPE